MKVAISSLGNKLDSMIDSRFGRCQIFIIYDTETKEFEVVNNLENTERAQGAGIQTAQMVVDQSVGCVITGFCGPKAFRVLKESAVKVYSLENSTIENAIELYMTNQLNEVTSSNK